MPSESAIAIRDLSFSYPGGTRALDRIVLEVQPGECVGLIGPNGAGKTTLFLCLAGVLPIAPGVVNVAGLDPARKADRRQLPARLGMIFQNSDDQLFSTTVADDVAFGPLNLGLPKDEVRTRVAQALQSVGLAGFDGRVPHHLSGGEKRRAALAGVLAMQPSILLLDEPSMFLDPRGRRDLMGLLKGLNATKIVASHDLDMILDLCERVYLLDRGRLVAAGPTCEVLGNCKLLEQHGLEVPYRLRKCESGERAFQA